ncbi:MAG: hypothetical protein ACM3Q2_13180 [Syntrophothermus sp.]
MIFYSKFTILFFLLALFIFSFTSCSSTRTLNTLEDTKFLENESVEVHLISDKIYETNNLFVNKDSTRLLDKSSGNFISVPTKDIKYIKDIHHTLGAFEWLAFGAAVGFTYGVIWEKTNTRNSHTMVDPRVYYGAVGALMGILPGSLIGHKIYYILPKDTKDSVTTKDKDILTN